MPWFGLCCFETGANQVCLASRRNEIRVFQIKNNRQWIRSYIAAQKKSRDAILPAVVWNSTHTYAQRVNECARLIDHNTGTRAIRIAFALLNRWRTSELRMCISWNWRHDAYPVIKSNRVWRDWIKRVWWVTLASSLFGASTRNQLHVHVYWKLSWFLPAV